MSRSTLVFVTQTIDPAHPSLAATIPKVAALAARFDEVAVLAYSAVPGVHDAVVLQPASLGFVRKGIVVPDARSDDNMPLAVIGEPDRTCP